MWPTSAPTAERLPFQIRTQGTAANGDWADRSLNFEESARTKIQFIQGAGYISETGCVRVYPGVAFPRAKVCSGTSTACTVDSECAAPATCALASSVATKDDFEGQCDQQAQYGAFVFDFEFDVLLVDAATDAVVQILCSGCQSDGENMWTGDWTPSRQADWPAGNTADTLYSVKVVEYGYGLVGRSSPLTVWEGVFDPTAKPTPEPTPTPTVEASNPTLVPAPVPTPAPTTPGLAMELHGADDHLVPLMAGADGGYLAAGEAVTAKLRFTGDTDKDAQVTVRLCRGEAVAGADVCTDRDGKFVSEVLFMQEVVYDASAATNDGTAVSWTMPAGVQAGNNYFFALFAYTDARRKALDSITDDNDLQEVFLTGAFAVTDYAPTPAPSPRPSTATPTNVQAGPTMNPTYEPTPKPAEDIPCTATIEDGLEDGIWQWGQDVTLKIKMCHWYSYSYGVVDVLLYGDVANADPVDSLAQYQSVHDNTLTVTYTVPKSADDFPDKTGAATCGEPPCYKLRVIEYGHGLDTGGWSSAGTWDRDDLVVDIRTKHLLAPSPEPTKSPSQDDTIDCFHTSLFHTSTTADQVEMNKIRKVVDGANKYGNGLSTPLAPGASVFANVEYWPLDRYSSGRGTYRAADGTYHEATAKEGANKWNEDTHQGRFVYPYVDGPLFGTDGEVANGVAQTSTDDAKPGLCSEGGSLYSAGSLNTPCTNDADCTDPGDTCALKIWNAVCSDDMIKPCQVTEDCLIGASPSVAGTTCVLKSTNKQGSLTGPEPMHTYWPFGYNRTTYDWTYGYCPGGDSTKCCCADVGDAAYFEGCTFGTCATNDYHALQITRQNVTVAAKPTKVTLRLCRGACNNDKNLAHLADADDRRKGDKKSSDAHGFFGALKYDLQVDANGPLGYGVDGSDLAAGENGPYESTDVEAWGAGQYGTRKVQAYGVVGGKVPLTLPADLETGDDYRILVHEESTGLTCRSDYFTIANADEVPTPAPHRADAPAPKPTPTPTHAPTSAPTPATITFAPEPKFWQSGSTQTVEITIGDVNQQYSYGFGAVVDLLIYKGSASDPVGTLAVYAQVTGNRLTVDFDTDSLTAGDDYRLRAIEYTRGLDVYSKEFSIGDGAPVPAPTPKPTTPAPSQAPTDDTVVVEVSGVAVGGDLVKDTAYSLQVRFTGDTHDEATSVTVCREESLRHNRCPLNPAGDAAADEIDNNAHDGDAVLVVKVGASTTFTFTPTEEGRFVLQAWTATQGAFTSPTYTVQPAGYVAPVAVVATPVVAPAPSAKPTLAPTDKGLQVALVSAFWVVGDAAAVTVRYTGLAAGHKSLGGSLDTDACYFDVVLFDADGAQAATLAAGAESKICELALSVDTAALATGAGYTVQASEYTVSGIVVTEGLAGTTVAAGASFTAALKYTGNLRDADGRVTVRLCAGSATPYAGPADAYDSCDQAGANLATAQATASGALDGSYTVPADLAAGTYYLRVDAIARTAGSATLDLAYGANRLAYVGASFTVA